MSWLMPILISDKKAVKIYYKKKSGRIPDLKKPKLFSEKLQWYKIYCRFPLMQQSADKYAVREYISKCGYGSLLNEVIGIYNHVDEIKFDTLPE